MTARAAFLALLLLPFVAQGTTVRPLDDDALYAGAQQVFIGVCTDARGEQDPSGRAVTRYTFAVNEGFKGVAGTSLELVQPGGTFAGRTLVVAGAARFVPGEEAVVFVGRRCPKSGCAFTVGLAQGKFAVRRGHQTVVRRDLRGLRFDGAVAPASGVRPLDPFLARLRERGR